MNRNDPEVLRLRALVMRSAVDYFHRLDEELAALTLEKAHTLVNDIAIRQSLLDETTLDPEELHTLTLISHWLLLQAREKITKKKT